MDIKKLFANEKEHRSLPFWSWNDRLEEDEVRRQVGVMRDSVNGGFFMHARGGLETEYLSDEWYEIIGAAIDEAKKTGLDAWAYDENGWPSGFADGIVPSRGFEYQQKRIAACVLEGDVAPENTVGLYELCDGGYTPVSEAKKGVFAVYMIVNKYYIDAFNPDSIKYFLEVTHDEYYKRFSDEFGKTLKGFFTDEPQFNNTPDFPWSHIFESEFSKRYGYSLTENLPALFGVGGDIFAVRYDFWRMVGELYRVNFLKQIYDWCSEHNCMLTGHIMGEVCLDSQIRAVADTMPCYEYFHIPGMDWLGRALGCALAAKQLGSAASQFGRTAITETFALCGWDVSLNDLRLIAGWQYVNGVSMVCQHLEAYTLRGLRKRDYPAALFMQLPWYDKAYGTLNTYFSKLGSLLTSCDYEPAPLLVIHPIYSASMLFSRNEEDKLNAYAREFDAFSDTLNDWHLLHHYGSEVIMERHGRVEGNEIIVGKCRYNSVLLPKVTVISENTFSMLLEYCQNGGKLFALALPTMINGRADERIKQLEKYCVMIDENDLSPLRDASMPSLIDENGRQCARVHITERRVGDEKLFYIINLSDDEHTVTLETEGEYELSTLDVVTEKQLKIDSIIADGKTSAKLHFVAKEAKVVLAQRQSAAPAAPEYKNIGFEREFKVVAQSDNMFTLDTCEYSINGGEWQPKKAVITLFSDLLELRTPCNVKMRFNFNIETMPSRLALLCETPEQFKLSVNGKSVPFVDCGYEIDKSFRKMDIIDLVKTGENELILETEFYQRQKVYDVIFGENVHETERNKLTYDTEIESIYLFGDFGVDSLDPYTYGERRSIFTGHSFKITSRPDTVLCDSLTTSGNLFFAGNMELGQTVSVNKEEGAHYAVRLASLMAPAAELFVNGKSAGMFAFGPFELDVTELLKDGENEFVFKLYSGNRNMLGPHHKPAGEVYDVGPATFTNKHGWSDDPSLPAWTDDYSFVEFGFKF